MKIGCRWNAEKNSPLAHLCARVHTNVLEWWFFSIKSESNFHEGLPKESLRLDQLFQNNLIKTDFFCKAFWISMPLIDAVVSDKPYYRFFLLSWWFSNIFIFTTWWCSKISTVDFTVLKNCHCCHGGIWRWVFLSHSAILVTFSSIKHDLTRLCFQLWPIIGDEGDKIFKEITGEATWSRQIMFYFVIGDCRRKCIVSQ